jgi:hypothetical protein
MASATVFACTHPKAPTSLPDGATATLDDMKAANALVKQYVSEMDDYLKCVDSEAPKPFAAGTKPTDEQKAAFAKAQAINTLKHNDTVKEEEDMAADWHMRLTAFKEKSKQ